MPFDRPIKLPKESRGLDEGKKEGGEIEEEKVEVSAMGRVRIVQSV